MKKKIRYYLLFLPLVLFTSCSKDEVNDYYARPDSLEDPIYQQLVARGNFKSLITLIEKAGYKDILGKSGYWTMMAPNDAAFEQFFQEKGYANAAAVEDTTAIKIVKYALIYNAFRTERLSDYQSNAGWLEDGAFKRRTAYYTGFTKAMVGDVEQVVVASNRNNSEGGDPYISGDNNNKYITYFMDEYVTMNGLSATDYNYFYPNTQYTGFNILGGTTVNADIVAENGIIHEVDKVSLPLQNIDQKLGESSNYSTFRGLLEDNLVEYVFDQEATTSYQNFKGEARDVYVKVYDPALIFSPNNENYIKAEDNDGQSDGYTLFVPNNTAMQEFINDVLLKKYTSLEQLPKYVFEDFFNAHMVQNSVWPSAVGGYNNGLEEDIRIDLNTEVDEAEVMSNGFFYGTSKVQASNLFYSVYTSAYLDPEFTLATRLFNDGSGYREIISNIYSKYVLFLPSDRLLSNLGYSYNINKEEWQYTSPINGNSEYGTLARNRLLRVLYNGIVPTPNGELSPIETEDNNVFTTSGIIRTGDLDLAGEYIKWDNGQVYAAGNEVLGNRANIIGYEVQQNGTTYYIDNLIEFSEEFQGKDLEELATQPGSQYEYFFEYLSNSTIYDSASGAIDGVELGTPYTFAIPNNAAIQQAVMDGVLPGDTVTGTPDFAPSAVFEQEGVVNFIKYHIIATRTASNDGLINGLTETLLKTELGEKTYVNISSSPEELLFTDEGNRVASFISAESNHLADRTLIHLIDNYLLYTE